ncbi:MAG: hypothetical protein M3068_08295 [Gemmatimonadota bacterium]|nr:hypothetical protein [Gemmatimonadota bacterium]
MISTRGRTWRCAGLGIVILLFGRGAGAQESARIQPELRLDALVGRVTAVQAGAGVVIAAGTYVRAAIDGGLGWANGGGAAGLSGRMDATVRFLVDPFFQSRWAPYGGGGIGARADDGLGSRILLVVVVGLEGPPHRTIVPFVEIGAGGGLRFGGGVRRALPSRR